LVKVFVKEMAEDYLGVTINYISGKPPVIEFFDGDGISIEGPMDLAPFDTEECVKLLTDRGFRKKTHHDDL